MSSRTLRLLISVAVIFGIFIYVASLQLKSMVPEPAADEGMLGGPVPGLGRWQQTKFREGKLLYEKNFVPADGLGPLYNGVSCAQCHGNIDTAGNIIQDENVATITRFASLTAGVPDKGLSPKLPDKERQKAKFSDLSFAHENQMFDQGGPVWLRKSISNDFKDQLKLAADCKVVPLSEIPKSATVKSLRRAPHLYGLGFANSLPDPILNYWGGQQYAKGIKAKVVQVAPYLWGWSGVGKFGLKAQYSTLYESVGAELKQEMGITSKLGPASGQASSSGQKNEVPECMKALLPADPNDNGTLVNKINFYLNTAAPPPRAVSSRESQEGQILFNKGNCAACHIQDATTSDKVMLVNPDSEPWDLQEAAAGQGSHGPTVSLKEDPKYIEIRALSNKHFSPFSDFLVHDMGPALDDGVAAPAVSSAYWRTTPLWGLRFRKHYLHDGRTTKLEEAISLHGGSAAKSSEFFKKLSPADKKKLIAFLNTL